MKYMIETIGCQMNVCQSDMLDGGLASFGAVKTADINEADIVILNTCSVRAQAEQKAYSFLGRAQELKNIKPSIKIAVMGCMAQRLGTKIQKRFKCVDLLIGTSESENACQKIKALFSLPSLENGQKISDSSNKAVSRFVTIMTGCDNFCSYCIVPFVRGRQTSVDADIIFNRCLQMAKEGAKEIILLGQNVNSYNYQGLSFGDLINKISEIDMIKRIRFMTNHPKDLSGHLIETLASNKKVCKHIHLPMQSASNSVLEAMNRKYTYEHYLSLINNLRERIPDISVTTDIIVGFPNETQEDFEKTLKAVEDIRFGGLYVFRYSPRPLTKAAQMKDCVSLEEKKSRHHKILSLSNEISAEMVSKMIGLKQEVLAEGYDKGVLITRAQSGRKVFVKGLKEKVGEIWTVIIKSAKVNALFGEETIV